ncbi:MAG: ABC transporter substrate-binding protein [Deltaproteobacteria bacterium]|nr:ABC transporter substrate-binding protein [Deltaproteobacteria bacterium]
MKRILLSPLAVLAFILFTFGTALSTSSLAQEWERRVKPRGTLKVVDLKSISMSVFLNYAEGLVTLDKDNNWVECLAQDWRWIDDQTIEFKLREGVRFHNGERFNAETVRINWEEYRKMKTPSPALMQTLRDETIFEIIDDYTVRFTFPEPDGIAFVKFRWFPQFAPAFFTEHKFYEGSYGYFTEPGPWGTGPFKLVEGSLRYGRPSDQLVLEAFEGYWDHRYPKVQRVVFDNTLIGDRKEALRLCKETERSVDIVSFIRPLDTLKVAMSKFAKVVKSRDVVALTGWINQRKRGSKWKDIKLRKALNYAVNRKELWKYGAKGNAHNLGGFIPPGAYGHNPDLSLYTYDTTKARSLLAEAGYPDGFDVKLITSEAWKLETQIIMRMLERIGLKAKFEVLTFPEYLRKIYIPLLDKRPEEQDWDIVIGDTWEWAGHTAVSILSLNFIEQSNFRWIDYDPVYEEMWKDMAKTVDTEVQEDKVRRMVQYLYEHAHALFIYSPISLYAVNKEVNFIPQKSLILRLKETSVTDKHWSVRGERDLD